MKKIITLSICIALTINVFSQNFVSTSPSNKQVLLEAFTGINCYYCAEGQAIAESIQNASAGNVVLVNIHSGLFAEPNNNQPDYRSPFATELAALSGLSSYPAAMFNRKQISGLAQNGNSYAIARANWQAATDSISNQPAVVNIAAMADIDVVSNQLKIVVETYYTANAATSTNRLFVALLVDSLMGPQSGAELMHPTAVNSDGKYTHRYILQDFVNGITGTVLNTTTAGSFRADTFYYPLPTSFNGESIDFPNFKVATWVATDSADILNVSYATRAIGGPNPIATSIESAAWTADFNQICGTEGDLILEVKNLGTDAISSVKVNYDINGGTSTGSQVYTFSPSIPTGYTQSALISNISGLIQSSNSVDISISEINTLPNPNISVVSTMINQASLQVTDSTNGVFVMRFDNFPGDVAWELRDETADTVVVSGSNYATASTTITQNFTAVNGQCYSLKVTDAYGDGICCAYGQGYFALSIGSVELIRGSNFTFEDGMKFVWQRGILSTQNIDNKALDWTLFPNPAQDQITINIESSNNEDVQIQIFNALGQAVSAVENYSNLQGLQQVNMSITDLPAGFYTVVARQGTQVYSKKLMVLE